MSADLLAAFGDPNSSSGSFQATAPSNHSSRRKDDQADGLGILLDESLSLKETKPKITHKQIIPEFDYEEEFAEFEQPSQNSGNEVLFDASNADTWGDDEEDEWGDFETAEPSKPEPTGGLLIDIAETSPNAPVLPSQSKPQIPYGKGAERKQHAPPSAVDLLSGEVMHPTASYDKKANHDRKSVTKRANSTLDTPELFSSWATAQDNGGEEEEEWGDFPDDLEPFEKPAVPKTQPKPSILRASPHKPLSFPRPTNRNRSSSVSTVSKSTPAAPTPISSRLRPANIPPPIILLSLFPSLVEDLQRKGSRYTSQIRSKGEASQSNLPYEIANVAKAMARILLGRSLRWKRDSILAQSTKIGPARAGKSGGMKLSSVNKSEAVKEDKEAVEVQEVWKKRAGLLNSVLTVAGEKPVPPMLASLQVKTATEEEGALKAPHACALCGLKRDERVIRIDQDANDSFGEWWTEYWGHTDCKAFWEGYSNKLDQR